MKRLYVYENPNPPADQFKVGIVGITGRVGSNMATSLRRCEDITVVGGVDISSQNDDLRGCVLEAVGLSRREYADTLLGPELFGECDLILDTRKRSIRFPEDLRAVDKPVLSQSAGDECPEEDEATQMFLPAKCEYSRFMRVGDCNVTALSAVVGFLSEYVSKAKAYITMMTTKNPEPDWIQDWATHGLASPPTQKSNDLYRPLFAQVGVKFKLRDIVQTGGIQCYRHKLDLTLRKGVNRRDFLSALINAPNVLVFPENVSSTFDVLDRAQRFQNLEMPFPPIVVHSISFKKGGTTCHLNIGVLNKYIAIAGNMAVVKHLANLHHGEEPDNGVRAMRETDQVMGWEKARQFFRTKVRENLCSLTRPSP